MAEYKWSQDAPKVGFVAQEVTYNEAMRLDQNCNLGIGTTSTINTMNFYTSSPKMLTTQNFVLGQCIEHMQANELLTLALRVEEELAKLEKVTLTSKYVKQQIADGKTSLALITKRMDSLM